MAIVRWDPFKDFLTIQEDLHKMFDRFLGGSEGKSLGAVWAPAIDVFEEDKELVIQAELPGLEAKDVDVTVEEDSLTLKGERKFEKEEKEDKYYRLERRYGLFQRTIPFPVEVKVDQAKAQFKDGVLRITIPKIEERKVKKIKVKVEK